MKAVLLASALSVLSVVNTFGQSFGDTGVGGDPSGLLSDMLREGFVEFYSSDPTNAIALETADYFRPKTVPVDLQPLPRGTLAEYRPRGARILISVLPIMNRWSPTSSSGQDEWGTEMSRRSVMESWRMSPDSLRDFTARTSIVVVHEVSHALYDRSLPGSYNSIEEELGARSREMLFLRARLRRDPGFLRLDRYDGLMRKMLASPRGAARAEALAPAARAGIIYPVARISEEAVAGSREAPAAPAWWRDPLPAGITRDQVDEADASVRRRFPGEFENLEMEWYLVRLLNSGVDPFWDYLSSVLPRSYEALSQDWDAHLKAKRAAAKRLERRIKRTRPSQRAELAEDLRELRNHIEDDQGFARNRDVMASYKAFFALEHEKVRKSLAEDIAQAAPMPAVPALTK